MERLQEEIRGVKTKWTTEIKLTKADKTAPGFPFPITVMRKVPQPGCNWDVDMIPVKLIMKSLEEISVEISDKNFPAKLPKVMADAVASEWIRLRETLGGFALDEIFTWAGKNFEVLLRKIPEYVDHYEGCDDEGGSCRRFILSAPDSVIVVNAEEALSEEEIARRQEEFERREEERLARIEEEAFAEADEKRRLAMSGMGEFKPVQLSKKELAALNPTNKEKAGQRMRKTASRASKPNPDAKKNAK